MNFKEAILKAPVVPVTPLVATRAPPSAQAQNVKQEKPKRKYIAAVISPRYGGFGVSEFAMQLYRKRYEKKFCKKFEGDDYDISREDSILVDLVKEFPDKVSGRYAKLVVVYYLSKYEGCFSIGEYDGNESCDIDVGAYKLRTINTLAKSTLTTNEKVRKINAILDDPCLDAEVLDALPAKSAPHDRS